MAVTPRIRARGPRPGRAGGAVRLGRPPLARPGRRRLLRLYLEPRPGGRSALSRLRDALHPRLLLPERPALQALRPGPPGAADSALPGARRAAAPALPHGPPDHVAGLRADPAADLRRAGSGAH